MESLNHTENAWLVEVVRAVDRGDVGAFENLRPRWSTVADLAAHEIRLRQKISLLRLMEVFFRHFKSSLLKYRYVFDPFYQHIANISDGFQWPISQENVYF